ncbi:MAG: hypothetical protein JNM00_04595 [Flavobacteriales bacterium]|nr:hypothetical protein [Flavobacteriales bacterium]
MLRLVLCVLNRQANDDHMEVIYLLNGGHSGFSPFACDECFQPLLYHRLVSGLISILHLSPGTPSIILAQLINFFSAFGFLWYARKLIKTLPFSPQIQLLCFSLLALNPKLIGIQSMATNDALVIFFSSASFCHLYFLSAQKNMRHALAAAGFAVLAAITKGNGLVMVVLVPLVFVLLHSVISLRNAMRITLASWLLVFALGPYSTHFIRNGHPFLIDKELAPSAQFFSLSEHRRPGVRSIAEAFFTFRPFSLLAQPFNTNGIEISAAHRTSYFSQLHGAMWSIHFERHPAIWVNEGVVAIGLGRVLLFLGFIPLVFLARGMLNTMRNRARPTVLISLCGVAAYLAFGIYYSMLYRDFACMKVIFIFPAILCFFHLFAIGLAHRQNQPPKATQLLIWALIISGIGEVLWLERSLWLYLYS